MTGTLNPVAFLYLRHGETDWNAAGLSQGNIDIALNQTGIVQAQAAASMLENRGIRSIVSSPLSRAHDTARVVAERLGLPVELDEALREVAFGVQEGQPMAGWFNDWVDGRFTPAGGEHFSDLTARAVAAVNRATARDPLVLIVGHGAFFRAVRAAAGLVANVRTKNATPIQMAPPAAGQAAWQLAALEPATA
ncbi:MAG: histidine phosphatase family protein [Acetobacteraceae bacterium]|nr:histidine phosphatase family protein [Acetobacteraceae bacterium]